MGILNYSSSIKAARTAQEISAILGASGANRVFTIFGGSDGVPTGVGFSLSTAHGERAFELPINVDGVLSAMQRDRTVPRTYKHRDQAERTAWRIVKVWIEAQVALIEAGQATIDEVMLPYLLTPSNETIYAVYAANEQKALESL